MKSLRRCALEESDTRRAPFARRNQPGGECEVSEMVRAELHLEAVGGALEGRGHDAGVVDEQTQRARRVHVAGHRAAHRGERCEVEFEYVQRGTGVLVAERLDHFFAGAGVSNRQGHLGARRCQRPHGLHPDA